MTGRVPESFATAPADHEPEDSTDHGEEHHDRDPGGLGHITPVPRRRLHCAIDDAVHPEHGGEEAADDQ